SNPSTGRCAPRVRCGSRRGSSGPPRPPPSAAASPGGAPPPAPAPGASGVARAAGAGPTPRPGGAGPPPAPRGGAGTSWSPGPPPPVVVGVDFAGVVDAAGAGAERFEVGARVVGGTNFARGQRGSYADTVVVREDQLCRVPDGVDLEVAGSLPITGVTAWRSV